MENQKAEILEPSVGCNMDSEVSHSKHPAHSVGVDHCGEGSSNHGDVDQHGEDFLHPRDVDQGREDSPCKSCLDIKSEIDTFIHSEGTGNMKPNALKTIRDQEITGFMLANESFPQIKEEHLEEMFCVKDSSNTMKDTQIDTSSTLSSQVKSVGPRLPLDIIPDINSTDPTETHHSHQLGPGVTTCVMLCDRGMECFHNNPGGAVSTHTKTVKRCPVLGNKPNTNEKPRVCKVSNKRSIASAHLVSHTGEKPYKCDVFGKRFTHSHTGEKPYKCNICGKEFGRKLQLLSHNRTHTGKKTHKCDVCGKCFALKCDLVRHTRTHTGEKPYKCGICGKGFSQKQHLVHHNRTHTGEKPYKCDICGKRFAMKQHLFSHNQTHTGEKTDKCDVCGKGFASKRNLVEHIRTHTGEKTHKCDICGKNFAKKYTLDLHNRTHTGEKPYKCDKCGKRFSQAQHLVSHSRTHTGEKPYKCDVCGKGFKWKQHLVGHSNSHQCNSGVCGKELGKKHQQSTVVNTMAISHTRHLQNYILLLPNKMP